MRKMTMLCRCSALEHPNTVTVALQTCRQYRPLDPWVQEHVCFSLWNSVLCINKVPYYLKNSEHHRVLFFNARLQHTLNSAEMRKQLPGSLSSSISWEVIYSIPPIIGVIIPLFSSTSVSQHMQLFESAFMQNGLSFVCILVAICWNRSPCVTRAMLQEHRAKI